MRTQFYSIRDIKGETFKTPFTQPTHGAAERYFEQLVQDEQSLLNKYPQDFQLFYVGNFNMSNGTIDKMDVPQHICDASTFTKINTAQ